MSHTSLGLLSFDHGITRNASYARNARIARIAIRAIRAIRAIGLHIAQVSTHTWLANELSARSCLRSNSTRASCRTASTGTDKIRGNGTLTNRITTTATSKLALRKVNFKRLLISERAGAHFSQPPLPSHAPWPHLLYSIITVTLLTTVPSQVVHPILVCSASAAETTPRRL